MAGNRNSRLGKVETALTPQQAVRQWLQEAHQYHSLAAYVAYLKTQPLAKYPHAPALPAGDGRGVGRPPGP